VSQIFSSLQHEYLPENLLGACAIAFLAQLPEVRQSDFVSECPCTSFERRFMRFHVARRLDDSVLVLREKTQRAPRELMCHFAESVVKSVSKALQLVRNLECPGILRSPGSYKRIARSAGAMCILFSA